MIKIDWDANFGWWVVTKNGTPPTYILSPQLAKSEEYLGYFFKKLLDE